MVGSIISLFVLLFVGNLSGASMLCVVMFMLGMGPWTEVVDMGLCSEKLTWVMSMLTVILLMYCVSGKSKMLELWVLTLVCCMFFFTNSGVMFYFSYEAMLLPVVWLLLKSGSEPERLMSAIYMVGYTFVGTLPMLMCGLNLISAESTQSIRLLGLSSCSVWVFMMMSLTFMVKLPLWGVHRWLPLAHVYSPMVGSIMLAGIMLKAGVYGLHLTFSSMPCRSWILFVVGSLGVVGSALCFYSGTKQSDLKAIIAFSSIMHMGVCLPMLAEGSAACQAGVISMMVGHGIASPVLFSVATSLGGSFNSRMVSYVKMVPSISFAMMSVVVVSLSFNAGFPPTLNFMAEVLGLVCCWKLSVLYTLVFSVVFVVGGLYGMYIWISVQNPSKWMGLSCMPAWKDIWALILLAIMSASWPLFI